MAVHEDFFRGLRAARGVGALGIDLGTTNSTFAVAQVDADGELRVTCLRDGAQDDRAASIVIPTAVAVEGDTLVFGKVARRLSAERIESAQGKSVFTETKNEIGLRYSYWKAPPELSDATAVAAAFLKHTVERFCDRLPSAPHVAVGVPAAFQGMQRAATLAAASRAGLERASLIDEPVATFIDLLHAGELVLPESRRAVRVLVFDFGGGTCDVALFDVSSHDGAAQVVLRGTSRYHRLGGGDIDRAIVHEVLVPQLLAQNGLASLDLSWRQKKKEVESRLLLVAEGLKIAMSRRLASAALAGKALPADTEMVDSGAHALTVDGRTLWLEGATLTLGAFRKILEPFLDDAVRAPLNNEYYQALSVFEPIATLFERLRIEPASVDHVLFAGGSSLVPPIRDAVLRYCSKATALGGTDPERLQGAVARGAALQALSWAVCGRPLIQPVSSMEVSIRTTDGPVTLIDEGAPLPTAARRVVLAAPRSCDDDVEISVELLAERQRLLFRQAWTLPGPVVAGEALDLVLTVDANQSIDLQLSRRSGDAEALKRRLESPLSHTDAGHKLRARILEREEKIRRGDVDEDERGVEYRRLAEDYASVGHYEKAIDAMRTAIRNGEDSAYTINLIGLWYGRLRDRQREVQCYERAIAMEPTSIAVFNLALAKRETGELDEALALIDRAIADQTSEGANRVLKADILERMGQRERAGEILRGLLAPDLPLTDASDWLLSWYDRGAHLANDAATQVRIRLERERRRALPQEPRIGVLPALAASGVAS